MIPPEVLNRKSLFSLLYKTDQVLAERTRARHCPFAGVRCTAPITRQQFEGVGLSDADSRESIQMYLDRNPGMSFLAIAEGNVVGVMRCSA